MMYISKRDELCCKKTFRQVGMCVKEKVTLLYEQFVCAFAPIVKG